MGSYKPFELIEVQSVKKVLEKVGEKETRHGQDILQKKAKIHELEKEYVY